MAKESDSQLRAREGGGRERVAAGAILLAGVAALLAIHWPGQLDPDSIATIAQARSGWIGDHRSAIATWLWREGKLRLGAGPGFFYVLQTLGLFAGLQLVLRGLLRPLWAAVATVAIVFSPWSIGFVGVVGRDVWFVAACLLALGLAIGATRWPRRYAVAAIVAGAVLVTLAVAARQNGVTAVLPLAVGLAAAALRLLPADGRAGDVVRRRRTLLAGIGGTALTVVVLGVAMVGTDAVRRVREYPEVYTQAWDLGFMTIERGERMIPPLPKRMQPVQTRAEVERRWSPTTSLYMRFDRALTVAPLTYSAAAARRMRSAWRQAIEDHPLLYLRGRSELWLRQLGIGYTPWHTYIAGNAANEWGYEEAALPWLSQAAVDYARFWSTDGFANGVIYHPWVFLLICAGGLVLLSPRFPVAVRMTGLLPAAGITAQVGLFAIAPSVQWRYQLLTAYAGLVVLCAAAALLSQRRAAGRRAAAPGPAAASA